MKKLFICIITTLISCPAFAAVVAGLSCEKLGYTAGQACPMDIEAVSACGRENCTLVSCASGCICAPDYTYCTSSGDTTCTKTCSDGTWVTPTIGASYQSRDTYVLNKTTCECDVSRTEYRCAPGYYDVSTGMTLITKIPDCAQCPNPDGTVLGTLFGNGATSAAGSKTNTACYIPKSSGGKFDTKITDSTGTYYFTDDCYYTE